MTATPDSQAELHAMWRQWSKAGDDPAVDAALRDLYVRMGKAIAERSPTCWISGRCCNFNEFGHRLYVTGLEIAWMLRKLEPAQRPAAGDIDLAGPCVFQHNKLCSVHDVRPLGCRIFFCQRGTEAWQQDLYEQFLGELRQMHDTHALPYRYMEWRAGVAEALAELGG